MDHFITRVQGFGTDGNKGYLPLHKMGNCMHTASPSTRSRGLGNRGRYADVASLTLDNCAPFLPKLTNACKVVDVYDGDTITVATLIDDEPVAVKIRLRGINCPEVRTKDANEKAAGLLAKQFLQDACLHQIVQVEAVANDKYGGRYLGDVFIRDSGDNLSHLMLQARHAVPYDGGRKIPYSEWFL